MKRSLIIIVAFLQLSFGTRLAFAEGTNPKKTPAAETTTQAPVEPVTGPTEPTGDARDTFIYNEKTGLWENQYYTWDPVTKKTAPKNTPDYSYNPTTGRWDTTQYYYDAPSGKYQPNIVSTATVPSDVKATKESANPTTTTLAGPSSNNGVNTDTNTNSTFGLFYNAAISNNIVSGAQSGNTTVTNNTQGGSAISGNALSMATVLNMLQSVWSPVNGPIATFTTDINGDVTGDLTIDPGQIPKSLTVSESNNDLDIYAVEDTTITNTINLDAGSGQSKVASNTSGGDATTGTATAVANVVNMLNSMISAGQSFVGTVNINGNLNGDILLPEDMINQLLASNVPRATLSTNEISNSNLLADFSSDTAIHNNVSADASSGAASVANNTHAGNATTGMADTNITILNLTRRQIIGSNALLVFVNVMGSWVGMIIDAPAGTTAAALGGGITADTATNLDTVIKTDSKVAINNDIKLAAHSGDAEVSSNTHAGNAKSGDAHAAANIANIANSTVSLGGWFGVLFINVLGNWIGSFGVNTTAGNQPTAAEASNGTPSSIQVFRFSQSTNGTTSVVPVSGGTTSSDNNNATTAVSGVNTTIPPLASALQPIIQKKAGLSQLFKLFGFSSLLFVGGESLLSNRKRRSLRTKFVEPLAK